MRDEHQCPGTGFEDFEGSVIVRWKVLLSPKCRKKTFKCHRKQVSLPSLSLFVFLTLCCYTVDLLLLQLVDVCPVYFQDGDVCPQEACMARI